MFYYLRTSYIILCVWLQGIGIALLLAQAFIGTYTVIGISWMFTYFRDSFITKQDVYRWAEPIEEYKEGNYIILYRNEFIVPIGI